jgi:hypothetical protein
MRANLSKSGQHLLYDVDVESAEGKRTVYGQFEPIFVFDLVCTT